MILVTGATGSNGIERAFLLTNSTARAEAQQKGFVAAARRSGVRHIVKLSAYSGAKQPIFPTQIGR